MRPIRFLLLLFILALPSVSFAQENTEQSVIILSYQRVDEPRYPDTNIQKDQFINQMETLASEGFEIVSLDTVYAALNGDGNLPKKAVAITFDGGYKSVMGIVPYITEHKIPVTIFLALNPVVQDSPQFLDERNIKSLRKKKFVTFGLTTHNYARFTGDAVKIKEQINLSKSAYRKLFDEEPKYFAYPFGEYDNAFKDIVEQQSFIAAFAQHSSPTYKGSDIYALPRFAMSEAYANLSRFQLIISAEALQLEHVTPDNPVLESLTPSFGFTLVKSEDKPNLSCYLSDQGHLDLIFLDKKRIEIRPTAPLTQKRVRLNCTSFIDTDGIRSWKWFGRLFTVSSDIMADDLSS